MSALDRFAAAVASEPVPLGEASLAMAAVLGHPGDVDEGLERLQALADGVPAPDLASVVEHLFSRVGLRGDAADYYDPRNSLVPAVLDRGFGNPVTLAVIAVDVATRLGVAATVVGMPGHVLIGDGDPPQRWVDGFHGGRWLDAQAARDRFASLHGPRAAFHPQFLSATPGQMVMARCLANLAAIYGAAGDASRLVRVRRMRVLIPAIGDRERPHLAHALELVGRRQEALELWEAERRDGSSPRPEVDATVARLRAGFN